MRIGIIQLPNSFQDDDTIQAIQRAGMTAELLSLDHDLASLESLDGYVITAAGMNSALLSDALLDLRELILALITQTELGKPLLGIGYGAHALVDYGLVPHLENYKVGMSISKQHLLTSTSMAEKIASNEASICLSNDYQRNAFTRFIKPTDRLQLPLACLAGCFEMTAALWFEIQMQGLNVFQYAGANVVGSVDNIAALSNKSGNILAMIPHPGQHSSGDAIFNSMQAYIAHGKYQRTESLYYYPRKKLASK